MEHRQSTLAKPTKLERVLGILEGIPEGVVIGEFLEFVPLDCPGFWGMEPLLRVLASLDRRFAFSEESGCFRKLTAAEYREARKDWYRDKFRVLMTDPHMLDGLQSRLGLSLSKGFGRRGGRRLVLGYSIEKEKSGGTGNEH